MRDKIINMISGLVEDKCVDVENTKDLVTSGILDSLLIFQLFTMLNEECKANLDILDITAENFDSVDSICLLIEKKTN